MFIIKQYPFDSVKNWLSQWRDIDFYPEYQRYGKIWSLLTKQLLIDSILNNYDIPKMYLADFSSIETEINYGKRRYAVIDGKQRLETIHDYINDDFPLDPNIFLHDHPEIKIGGLRFSALQHYYPEIAGKLTDFPLPIMHVVTDEIERINELFLRLNRGSPLTGAEVRNAMLGPLPRIFRDLAKHQFFKEKIRFGANRGEHLNAAAKVCMFEFHGSLSDTKKKNLDKFVEEGLNKTREDFQWVLDQTYRNVTRMDEIFEQKDTLLRRQGAVPLYYWFVRNLPVNDLAYVRPFLASFEDARLDARRLSDEEVPHDIARYNYYNRSTNDQGSLEIRTEILNRWFSRFSASKE